MSAEESFTFAVLAIVGRFTAAMNAEVMNGACSCALPVDSTSNQKRGCGITVIGNGPIGNA